MTINVGILIIIGIRLPIVVHAIATNTAGALGIEREKGKEIEKEATMIDTTERAPEIETHIEIEADIIVQDPEQKVQKSKKINKKSLPNFMKREGKQENVQDQIVLLGL